MTIITTTEELKALVKRLENEKFVTMDSEFIRDYTYYPDWCLLQVAAGSGGGAYAIDPLAKGIDLSPLKKILKDKKIMKVMHSAEQDIEILWNDLGTIPEPLFDTQIAGQVLGYGEAASYATLVKDICNVTLDKSSRFTDWARRPLSQKQVDYALCDVTYLRDIYVNFDRRLGEVGRRKWIEEDVKELLDPKRYKNDPKDAWLRFRSKHSSPTFMGILRELSRWREEVAQEENIPRSRILRDDAVSEIAAAEPTTMADLKLLRRIHEKSAARYGEEIIKMVKRGRRFPLRLFQPKRRVTVIDSEALIALLKVLLKRQCEKHNVAQKLVATVEDVRDLSMLDDRELKKSKMPLLHGWRYEVFGKYALKLMRGELALMVEDNNIQLLEQNPEEPW